jgi:hypothetical protein
MHDNKMMKTNKDRVMLMAKALPLASPSKRRELEGRLQSKDNENAILQQQLAEMQRELEESKRLIAQHKEDTERELMEAKQTISEQQALQERVMEFVVSEQSTKENDKLEQELQRPEEHTQQNFRNQLSQALLGRSAQFSETQHNEDLTTESVLESTPNTATFKRPALVFDASTLSEMIQIKQRLAVSNESDTMTPVSQSSGSSMVFDVSELRKMKESLRHATPPGGKSETPGSQSSTGSSAERVFKSALLQSLASRRMRLAAETPEQGTPCAEVGAFGTQIKVYPSPPGDNGVAQFLVVCSDDLRKVDVKHFEQAISEAVENLDGEKQGRTLAMSPLYKEQNIADVTSANFTFAGELIPPSAPLATARSKIENQTTKNMYTDCLRSRKKHNPSTSESGCTVM